jgi:hypothetical protein
MLAPSIYSLIVAALAVLGSPVPSAAAESPCPSVLDHQFSNLRDESVSLCQFHGKVLLIVNTARDEGCLEALTYGESKRMGAGERPGSGVSIDSSMDLTNFSLPSSSPLPGSD